MRRTLLILTALSLASTACESGTWTLQGQVAVVPDEDAVPRGVAQATVALQCGKHRTTVKTDRAGAFSLGGHGKGPRMDCVVEITAPRHEPWRAELGDVCADDDDDDHCETATVLATLRKKPEASAQR
ncbi:MAG: hypothetical protein JST92_03635 [Deltaproteobacteria bacterium]|nr:hypothetical protein [Deltaproteobacteria bacterium]